MRLEVRPEMIGIWTRSEAAEAEKRKRKEAALQGQIFWFLHCTRISSYIVEYPDCFPICGVGW